VPTSRYEGDNLWSRFNSNFRFKEGRAQLMGPSERPRCYVAARNALNLQNYARKMGGAVGRRSRQLNCFGENPFWRGVERGAWPSSRRPPSLSGCEATCNVSFRQLRTCPALGLPPLCAITGREQMQQTASYSISSSASASSVDGTVRPSAFAVVRLMMRSNLVGCSTGRSAGFAPRRTLST
jgi:hypothetical protein